MEFIERNRAVSEGGAEYISIHTFTHFLSQGYMSPTLSANYYTNQISICVKMSLNYRHLKFVSHPFSDFTHDKIKVKSWLQTGVGKFQSD